MPGPPGDPDPGGLPDFARVWSRPQPGFSPQQRATVPIQISGESLTELARTIGDADRGLTPTPGENRLTLQDFRPAQENCRRPACGFTDHIETVMYAVAQVHVQASRGFKHMVVAPGPAKVRVGGFVLTHATVRLDLNQTEGDQALLPIPVHENLAEEFRRHDFDRPIKKGLFQPF